jgi:hypothetical protein
MFFGVVAAAFSAFGVVRHAGDDALHPAHLGARAVRGILISRVFQPKEF